MRGSLSWCMLGWVDVWVVLSCFLWAFGRGGWRGKQRLTLGRTRELLGFFSPALLDN